MKGRQTLWISGAALAVLPFFLPNTFYLDLAIRMLMNAVVVLGLNLLMGYAGQISLGHAGFLGIGAYASAVLPVHFGWPPLVAMLVGALASGVLAALLARPIFRLKGYYLAMATLGLGFLINAVLHNETRWTGGSDGMAVPPLTLGEHALQNDYGWYALVAVLLLGHMWMAFNLVDSPFGRAMRALHGSEIAARSVGVDTARYKLALFVGSAVGASLVGSLNAHYVGFVSPNLASFSHSIELVTMVIVGGLASVHGALAGAVLLTGLPQMLARFEGWETVVFGAILVSCMIFLPQGVVPGLAHLWRTKMPERLRRWSARNRLRHSHSDADADAVTRREPRA